MIYNKLVNLPVMDLVEQLIKKSEESFTNDESKSFFKSFYKELFDTIGDLSKNEDLSLLLDFLITRQYKFHFSLSDVEEEKQARLLELYGALIIKIRTDLKQRGVL